MVNMVNPILRFVNGYKCVYGSFFWGVQPVEFELNYGYWHLKFMLNELPP
jgi:hypothetical protein